MKTRSAHIFSFNQLFATATMLAVAAWVLTGCGQPQQTGEPSSTPEAGSTEESSTPAQPEGGQGETEAEGEGETPSEPSPEEEQQEGETSEPSASTEEPSAQAAASGGEGAIAGTITLKGEPPEEKKIPLDPACGKLHDQDIFTRFYVVGQDNALADVFVHVKEGLGDQSFEAPSDAKVLDQKGCEYQPYVFGIQTEQTLTVKNSDPVLHNVHTVPGVDGNPERNVAQLPAPQGQDLTFNFPEEELFLKFKCDVHPWMYSYAGIVDHPFYTVTSEDGSYELAGLPAGDYVIEAYHRKAGKFTQEVSVTGGETKTVDFTIPVPQGQ